MRLKKVKLRNFRGYAGDFEMSFDLLTALVGRNDVGKSSILEALAIFFESSDAHIDKGDLCVHAASTEIRIGCVFDELPHELVLDSACKTNLEDEYLLNGDGLLEVWRIYECAGAKPKESVCLTAMHPSQANLSDLLSTKIADLKKLAIRMGVDTSSVDLRSASALRKALWAHCPDLALQPTDLELAKEDGKTIWEQLWRQMPLFALFRADRASTDEDAEVQDPMKLAVKHALQEMDAELEQIKSRVRERTLAVAHRTVEKLKDFDPGLAKQLTPEFKAEPSWAGIFKLTLTGDDAIPINKRGSGVRRLVLLSFFRAEAERLRSEQGRPGVIYAVEEPETSQHPSNQRLVVDTLTQLSERDGHQVILTTHVPGLAGLLPVQSLRHVSIDNTSRRRVKEAQDAADVIADDLGVLPDHYDVHVLVYVEGPNDVTFLRNIGRILRAQDATLPDLDRDPRVAMVPLGGSCLKAWVNQRYLKNLHLPEVHLYDRDDMTKPKYQVESDSVNARGDGSVAFITRRREMENYLHPLAIKVALDLDVAVDVSNDVGAEAARATHEKSASPKTWAELADEVIKDKVTRAKNRLNAEAAKQMSPGLLRQLGVYDEVLGWFVAIRDRLGREETAPASVSNRQVEAVGK